MDAINSAKPVAGKAWTNVVVSSEAMAAIRQLHDDEQTAINTAIRAIGESGLTQAAGITATELDPSERAYYLRISGAPEVRIIAREVNSSMVEILDVVRPQTIHNLFHAS